MAEKPPVSVTVEAAAAVPLEIDVTRPAPSTVTSELV